VFIECSRTINHAQELAALAEFIIISEIKLAISNALTPFGLHVFLI
jgi:hypothetical protein